MQQEETLLTDFLDRQVVPSLSDAEVISIVQALRPEQLSLIR